MLNRLFDLSTPSMRNIELSAKSKMAAREPQNCRRGLEWGVILGYIGCFKKLSQNKFYDMSSTSLRNIEQPAKSNMATRGPKIG